MHSHRSLHDEGWDFLELSQLSEHMSMSEPPESPARPDLDFWQQQGAEAWSLQRASLQAAGLERDVEPRGAAGGRARPGSSPEHYCGSLQDKLRSMWRRFKHRMAELGR